MYSTIPLFVDSPRSKIFFCPSLKQNSKNSWALGRTIDLGSGKSSNNGTNTLYVINNAFSHARYFSL